MKRILIISPGQFGTHNGTYHYCNLLSREYIVTYFGFDEGHHGLNSDNINIIHIDRRGNYISDKICFILTLKNHIKTNKYDCFFVNYFLGCSFVNLFLRKKTVVDIRTGNIHKNWFKRYIFNLILLWEVCVFKNVTVISKSLSLHLKLPLRAHIVPLGSPLFPKWDKKFDSFRILYVGTFHQRNIQEAIIGFSKFYFEFKDLIYIEWSIIGTGSPEEIKLIDDLIFDLGLRHVVKYLGVIRYPELNDYFEENNIGVSFIPITEYFNYQPPTKTFEYLSSGMITLATSTLENSLVVEESNGVLIRDNKDGVYDGFKYIYQNRDRFNSLEIQNKVQQFSWNNIVYNNLIPFLNNID